MKEENNKKWLNEIKQGMYYLNFEQVRTKNLLALEKVLASHAKCIGEMRED